VEFDRIDYLRWAKSATHHPEVLDLASSGMTPWSIHELSPRNHAVEIIAPNTYGFPPLKEAIADHHGVTPEQVLITAGSSMANFLSTMALVNAGDTVLVEEPAYEPLRRLPALFGCTVKRIQRSLENGWILTPEDMDKSLQESGARLVILSNPHNPTGVMLDMPTVEALHEICKKHQAYLILDEVYAEFHPHDPAALAKACSQYLIRTSSLTKVLGFGPLRIGWAIADAPRVEKMYALNDYAYAVHGAINESLGLEVWRQRARFLEIAHSRAAFNLGILRRFLGSRDDLDWVDPQGGILGFIKVHNVDNVDALTHVLQEEHGVRVAPGTFFERPSYIRIGFGTEPDKIRVGLTQLGRALNNLK
jgi:aspartate/methionine/tyrosine aminotransferase